MFLIMHAPRHELKLNIAFLLVNGFVCVFLLLLNSRKLFIIWLRIWTSNNDEQQWQLFSIAGNHFLQFSMFGIQQNIENRMKNCPTPSFTTNSVIYYIFNTHEHPILSLHLFLFIGHCTQKFVTCFSDSFFSHQNSNIWFFPPSLTKFIYMGKKSNLCMFVYHSYSITFNDVFFTCKMYGCYLLNNIFSTSHQYDITYKNISLFRFIE